MFSRLITRDRSLRKQQQQQQQHEAQKEPPVRKNQAEKQSSLCHKEGEQTQAKAWQGERGGCRGVTCSGCEVNQFMQSASSGARWMDWDVRTSDRRQSGAVKQL